jgi:rRNA 2'-O-methyltransferase fibrillarin
VRMARKEGEAFVGRGEGRDRGVPLLLQLSLLGGGFQAGGNRGRGRGGKRGNQSGKNVMVEPHRHEGE